MPSWLAQSANDMKLNDRRLFTGSLLLLVLLLLFMASALIPRKSDLFLPDAQAFPLEAGEAATDWPTYDLSVATIKYNPGWIVEETTATNFLLRIYDNIDERSQIQSTLSAGTAFTAKTDPAQSPTSVKSARQYFLNNLPARTLEYEQLSFSKKDGRFGAFLNHIVLTEVLTGHHLLTVTFSDVYRFNAVPHTQVEGEFKDYSGFLNNLQISDR